MSSFRNNNSSCKIEGCNYPVWAKGVCKKHTSRKALRKTRPVRKRKIDPSFDKEAAHREKRYYLFLDIWKKRGAKSEVSSDRIYTQPSSANFHHILPKNKYPDADLDPNNIIVMTIDEHNNVEGDMYKYEEVNKRRHILMKKYNLI